MMDSLQIGIAKAALQEMMNKGYFSICTIDSILKMSGAVPNRKDYDMLHALHCVHFKDMPANVRIELPRIIQRVVESRPMTFEVFGERIVELPEFGSNTKSIGG